MRTFVLLLVFAIPPLVACSAAYAKTSADIGKPVCMHYDDSSNPATRTGTATVAASSAASASVVHAKTLVAAANQPAPANPANGAQPKGGGMSDAMRTRNAPHWQTFLPGMFR